MNQFTPKLIKTLASGYSFGAFRRDLLAGVTVGVIALPLAMAFAIASGVSPARGIFTAIVAGFLTSLFGGSRIQISGPTGAFVVIIYDIIQRTGYAGLCTSTLIAAAMLLLIAVFRLGSWIKYIPHPLIVGFTSGIAVLIFSSQIKDFFGLKMGTPPPGFADKWISYYSAMPTLDWKTAALSGATLLFILFLRRRFSAIPWGIAAIGLATGVSLACHLPIDTIASRFGEIPRTLPFPAIPALVAPNQEILLDAMVIAFLCGIESLLSAVIGDRMIGARHRPNCELLAQGIGNIGSIFFGGIPSTGALARTAANVKSGAQSPIAGMIHSLTLLLILYVLAPIVGLVPLAGLSAVLMMVAWNMSELGHFIQMLKAPLGDRLILFTSFFLTVFVDLTVAITFGMILASMVFMKRMSQISKAVLVEEGEVEVQGPFFFGSAHMLRDLLTKAHSDTKVCVLRMRHVPMVDASGIFALKEFAEECKKGSIRLILSDVAPQVKEDLDRFGIEIQMKSHIYTERVSKIGFVAAENARG